MIGAEAMGGGGYICWALSTAPGSRACDSIYLLGLARERWTHGAVKAAEEGEKEEEVVVAVTAVLQNRPASIHLLRHPRPRSCSPLV